nr:C1 family peptidase [uncultured Carboxylicivirga sp.]
MKKLTGLLPAVLLTISVSAQNSDKAKIEEYPQGKGFYYETILKDISHVKDSVEAEPASMRLTMDQSEYDLPNKVDLYKRQWANPVLSQGNTGTCWDFSTLSFYESEIFRMTGKKVKLSEMYVAYYEYLAKAERFIEKRGESLFSEGSEGNAVARIALAHGLVPADEYTGLIGGRKYHDHGQMMEEMSSYLKSLTVSNAWNKEAALETIASIMDHYIGVPPTSFKVDGKEYSPMTYMKEYLKLDPNDFVEILSYKQKPYWQQVEYTVPDNWWHNEEYYNVPLDVYMDIVKKAIRKGYTMSIGGDVSEAGFLRSTQCAMIPDFDIPSAYINEDARAFRFANETTTDDHGMHLVGYMEKDGKDWYLIKDSSSGSRNNDPNAPEFGYYFFTQDYVKLKMMGFTIHKDAVKDVLKKFKK